MSRLDVWMKALTTLAQRPTWKLQELPNELLDADLLTALDMQGWIEFWVDRVHREGDSGSAMAQRVFRANPPGPNGPWFSPASDPKVAGTVAEIILDPFTSPVCAKKYGAKGPCIEDRSELRLTSAGRLEPDRIRPGLDATQSKDQENTPPLPELQRAVWDKLCNTAMQAPELARCLDSSEDAIRQRVKAMRDKGYDVKNAASIGYYRPDAPPPDFDTATPTA